ncbi:FHA domain-containing protein [Verminephrobacter aporrectodeae subsp. tuberculatae]|uniref:ATPase, T2SS/T4P/T4SS family n=1 Tax=Verminephrobacter aporrectodeae TaxID=1110389 RepID=UPI0022431151|nr:ATPase, T2SS/T4P/T4SS family [Verminephrobacter aporrectodeae]MCW8166500.1 FHA domain-containing protein [Verminephrobacter aporrectodeae subsp. tuberculatae]MCW8170677.1 FHA domain-containing protein [Verminephrobacter aporrectodeae subsp. tuberculatae]
MIDLEITHPDGQQQRMQVPDTCSIGKGMHCELRLDNWRISKEHARLLQSPAGVLLEDGGSFGGVLVNGQRIDAQYGPVQASDTIGIGSFRLRVLGQETIPGHTSASASAPARHDSAESKLSPSGTRTTAPPPDLMAATAAPSLPTLHTLTDAASPLAIERDPSLRALEFEWRKRLHAKLIETMDLRRHDVSGMSDEHLRTEAGELIAKLMQDMDADIPAPLDRDSLRKQILDEAVGLGPLEELLSDDTVTEVMVNRFDEIYIECAGRLQKHSLTFTSDHAVMGVIERIVAPLGRRIDESSPMVDARLKDGSRVNAIIPPLALKGSTLTIRKFAKRKLSADDLVQFGALSPAMADFLRICVEARKNIIVSGGTGSGKTTLLNILSNFIPPGERVITVEDAAELKLNHEHLISLESRPANVEGKGGISIRELVRNTLRMRPDRIVVGECRGAEALDMLQAMNTGHEGSLTTLHANSPRDGLARLETMVLMAGMELPLAAIREQIASAVDIIVQQTRFSCGTRMVTYITEISGMESGKIQLQDLFLFVNRGYAIQANGLSKVQGQFSGCDTVPHFYDELRASGAVLDLDIFRGVPGTSTAGAGGNAPGERERA